MQYTTAIVLAITGFATAQSTAASSAATPSIYGSQSSCNPSVDTFITKCLSVANGYLAACDWLDYDCLCDKQRYVLACYENCPSDPRHARAEYTRISYCTNANFFLGGKSSYSSIANGTVSTTSGSNSFSTIGSSSATYTDVSSSNSTVSSSASSASSTATPVATDSGAGGKVFSPAGSFLTAMFGLTVVL